MSADMAFFFVFLRLHRSTNNDWAFSFSFFRIFQP